MANLTSCPGSSYCCSRNGSYTMEMPKNVAYVSILSSFCSCVASIVIVFMFVK